MITLLLNKIPCEGVASAASAAAGIKPEFTFEINDFEYDDENFLRYPSGNGTIYTIIRAPKRGEMRELVCTTLAGVNGNG